MRVGSPRLIARPMRKISARFAPTTPAIRSVVTNGQLRQTNACRRLGKCGNETGLGAGPLGRSETEKTGVLSFVRANAGKADTPRASAPSVVEAVPRKRRRDWRNDSRAADNAEVLESNKPTGYSA